jgi:polyisoprenoid-binding protein YceI
VWLLAAAAAFTLPFAARAALVRTGNASVVFVATGPGGLRIVGKSGELQVADSGAALKITAPLGNLKTGIDLRDRHLRDKYLHVRQHPNAVLEVQRGALKHPTGGGSVASEADGTLTLHGKAKSIRFKYSARHEGGRIKVEGGFRIDIRDFGIEVPSYLGLKVKPEVDANAQFYVTEGK